MDKKNAIEQIKGLAKQFFSTEEVVEIETATEEIEATEEVVEVELADVTTKDGIVLSIAEDGSVTIDGEVAPDGTYILEDDSEIIVKDGMKVEEEESTEEVVETEEEEVVEEPNEMEALTARVDDLEAALAELLSMFNSNKEEVDTKMSKISKLPADKNVKLEKTLQSEETNKKTEMSASNAFAELVRKSRK